MSKTPNGDKSILEAGAINRRNILLAARRSRQHPQSRHRTMHSSAQAQQQPAGAQQQKPNVVFILADNIGYGDLGVYGSVELRGAPTPGPATTFDILMLLANKGGRIRTEAEFRALSTAAGLKLERVIPRGTPNVLLEGTLAHLSRQSRCRRSQSAA